jgi:NAD(P)H-hydrate epimerase
MKQCFPNVGPLPEVDTTAMIEVDRLMMEDYRISLFQMMENAGRCMAILAREILMNGAPEDKRVVVLAGGGGNGGGALTAARRLATWGAKVCVVTAQGRDQMADVPKAQLDILLGLENVVEMTVEEIDGGFFADAIKMLVNPAIGSFPTKVAQMRQECPFSIHFGRCTERQ